MISALAGLLIMFTGPLGLVSYALWVIAFWTGVAGAVIGLVVLIVQRRFIALVGLPLSLAGVWLSASMLINLIASVQRLN